MTLLNALTVDVEDYYQVTAFEKQVSRESWNDYESRVVRNTRRTLDLFARHGRQATFFVLGWVARKFPELVREIHGAGHEVGSHSFWHRLVYELTPEEFRSDLRLSRDVLQDILGEPVTAYRAPSFSITRQSLWAFEILAEEGFTVDSSVFPIHHDRYGIADAEERIHPILTAAGAIWEFPASVIRLAKWNLPVSGGGYFRCYPLSWTRYSLGRINRFYGRPFMFYFHPWELDPEQPRLPAGTRLGRLRHYLNLSSVESKLSALLKEFHFGPMRDVLAQQGGERSPTLPLSGAESLAGRN